MYDIIVIGGGPAGVTAALRARELGATVALVERGALGGACTNDGCVPTRVLARAARLIVNAQQYEDFGLSAAPPELDFPRLLARTQHIVYTIHEKKQLISHLQQAGAEVLSHTGGACFVDAHTIALPGGRRLQAEKFILCAGGRARRLDFPGEEYALTHSDVWSLQRLPRSVAVVGGAATGCQLASIFAAFGAKVAVIDVAPRLLRAEDEDVSLAMAAAYDRRGVQVITNIGGIRAIERNRRDLTLVYTVGDQPQRLDAEAIILSTGWLGNLDALNLAAAGVETDGRYVKVDGYLRTSAPHIFAAGDINGHMMLVQSASHEARIAAENAVLGVGQPYTHAIVPHGGFTDPEYASVGLTEAEARAAQECVVASAPYTDLDRAVIDGRTEGFCKLIVSQETHRMLGAHVVGEQAVEIVQVVAAGMAAGMWVEQLAELEIAYPTFTAILGLAARQIVRELGVMPLAPEWQALARVHVAEWERRAPA